MCLSLDSSFYLLCPKVIWSHLFYSEILISDHKYMYFVYMHMIFQLYLNLIHFRIHRFNTIVCCGSQKHLWIPESCLIFNLHISAVPMLLWLISFYQYISLLTYIWNIWNSESTGKIGTEVNSNGAICRGEKIIQKKWKN